MQTPSSSPPKLRRDLVFFLTLFLSFVAKVLGDSSPVAAVAASVSLSDECLVRCAVFAFVRLKMTGDVEGVIRMFRSRDF